MAFNDANADYDLFKVTDPDAASAYYKTEMDAQDYDDDDEQRLQLFAVKVWLKLRHSEAILP